MGIYVNSYCCKAMEAKPAKPRCAVLIVEDEPLVRVTRAGLLAKAGFEYLEAGNAEEVRLHIESEIVKRPSCAQGFAVLPRRWVVDGSARSP
jgi:hypothetical protein